MSKRIPRPIIIDMLTCAERIQDYTAGISFEEFESDGKTRDAVLRNIQVMGEAANRLPAEFKINHPEIEWSKIIRSRNIVTHDYDAVDYSVVWKIITVHLPSTKNSLENILKSL